jgi:hypothetical protein
MWRLNDRIALYFWLKSIGACRAELVFWDNPQDVSFDDFLWCFDGYGGMTFDVFCCAVNYLEGENLLNFVLDCLLALADNWSWAQNDTTRRHYKRLRYPPYKWLRYPPWVTNQEFYQDDLPF